MAAGAICKRAAYALRIRLRFSCRKEWGWGRIPTKSDAAKNRERSGNIAELRFATRSLTVAALYAVADVGAESRGIRE